MRSSIPIPSLRRVLVGAAAVGLLTPAASALAANDPVAQAEARVTAARRAADGAAAASDAAEARAGEIDHDIGRAEQSIASLRTEQRHLAAIARERALVAYRRPTLALDNVVGNGRDVLDAARRAELLDQANERGNDAIRRLDRLSAELHDRESRLRDDQQRQKKLVADLRRKEEELRRAVDEAAHAEQALRARLQRERRAQEAEALLRRARAAARPPSGGGRPGIIIGSGSWACPVQGAVSFTDTFGAPRSGGRTHKGVDMFAARGTPVVAVVTGSVLFQGDRLGGNAAYVNGNDGNVYYYAHLNDYVGGARSVSAGELIAHVGNTGDADGGAPHLHFEIRPGGGPAIDPYPTVAAHC